jgi:hypothetical protein
MLPHTSRCQPQLPTKVKATARCKQATDSHPGGQRQAVYIVVFETLREQHLPHDSKKTLYNILV